MWKMSHGVIIGSVVILSITVATWLLLPRSADSSASIDACIESGPYKEQCFQDLIMKASVDEGLEVAFDRMSEIYSRDRAFASTCHGATHELGRLAYDLFSHQEEVPLSEKTSYCGFGFFHGFLEELFETSGDLSEAREFCEYVDLRLQKTLLGVSFACYHGIGHGVVDGTDPELWNDAGRYIEGGLALCESLSDVEEHKERCASGVFNALAIAYENPKYSLGNDANDPFAICREQERRYAREACYDQMNGYLAHTNATFADALRVALTAEEAYTYVAIHSLAGYTAQIALPNEGDLSSYMRDCEQIPAAYREGCAKGFATGLIEFGNPQKEHVRAIETCKGSGVFEDVCFHGVMNAVKDRLSPDIKDAFCVHVRAEMGLERGALCEETMRSA